MGGSGFLPGGFDILLQGQKGPDDGSGSTPTAPKPYEKGPRKFPPLDLKGVKPWNEVATQFDPMMPRALYDQLREKYFFDNLAPRIRDAGLGVQQTYERFKKDTDREPLLKGMEKITEPMMAGVDSFFKEIDAPFASLGLGDAKADLARREASLKNRMTVLERDGLPSAAPAIVGSLVGMGVDVAALSKFTGPLSAVTAGKAFKTAKGIKRATEFASNSLSFGAYEALREQDGDKRLVEGLKGAALGAAWEGVITAIGIGASPMAKRVADRLKRGEAASNPLDEALDTALAQDTIKAAEVARGEGRELKVFVTGVDEATIRLSKPLEGGRLPATRSLSLKGKDADKTVTELLANGWGIDEVNVGKENLSMYEKLKKSLKDQSADNYTENVIYTNGQSELIASAMNQKGYKATVLSPDRISVTSSLTAGAKWKVKPPDTIIRGELARLRQGGGLSTQKEIELQAAIHNAWASGIDQGVKDNALEVLNKHLPNLMPPSGLKASSSKLTKATRPLKENFGENLKTGDGIPSADMVQRAVDEMVDPHFGVWSPALGRNLSHTEVIEHANTVWDLTQNGVKRGESWNTLYEAGLGSLLPVKWGERYNTLPQGVKDILSTTPQLKQAERAAMKKELEKALSAEDEEILTGISGETREALIETLARSKRAKLEVPPGEADDTLAAIMAEAQKQGGGGKIRGVKKAEMKATGGTTGTGEKSGMHIEGKGLKQERNPAKTAAWLKERRNDLFMQKERLEARRIKVTNEEVRAGINKELEGINTEYAKIKELLGAGELKQMASPVSFPSRPELDPGRPSFDPRNIPSNLKERPLTYTGELTPGAPAIAGGQGVTANSMGAYAVHYMGKGFSEIEKGMFDKPLILAPKGGWKRPIVYHESMHAMSAVVGLADEWYKKLAQFNSNARKAMYDIAGGLKTHSSNYSKYSFNSLMDEAFTWASTAVREGQSGTLAVLADWDTSVKNILEMVNIGAKNLALNAALAGGDSVVNRRAMRVAKDLIRRTADDTFLEIDKALLGEKYLYWDKDTVSYVLKTPGAAEGEIKYLSNKKEIWDYLDDMDPSETAPNHSMPLEMMGMKGPFVPLNMEPRGKPLPLANTQLDPRWEGANWGWQAFRGWTRPFFSWAATVDQKLNKFFVKTGEEFPLNAKIRDVDDAHKASATWTRIQQNKLVKMLENVKPEKLKTIWEWGAYPVEDRAFAAKHFGLTQEDMNVGLNMKKWFEDLGDETGIRVNEYWENYYPQLRKNSFNADSIKEWPSVYNAEAAGFWEKMIRGGDSTFEPQRGQLAEVADFALKQGIQKKFVGAPIKELEKLIERKTPEGKYILPSSLRGPLTNYAKYMKGFPDPTQQAMNNFVGGIQRSVSRRITEINKNLPPNMQLPAWEAPPQQTLNRLMLFSYVGGLGGRLGANIRDLAQGLITGATVVGPGKYWKAAGKILSDHAAAFDKAEKAGALLQRYNVGELWGDIYNEIPQGGKGLMNKMVKFSNMVLSPQRITDNFNRAILFTAERESALEALKLYKAGKIDVNAFINDYTTLWWADESNVMRLMDYASQKFTPKPAVVKPQREIRSSKLVQTVGGEHVETTVKFKPEEEAAYKVEFEYKGIKASSEEDYLSQVADKIANELLDNTMWPYRKGGQPAVLKTGLGRVLGQYGMYPMNYLDFLRRIGAKMANPNTRMKAAKMGMMFSAVNYGAAESMEGLGAEWSQWLWASPGAYAGGPNMQFVMDAMKSLEQSDEGRAARARVLKYPLNFVPFNVEIRNLIKATSEEGGQEGLLSPAVIRVLGMKPHVEVDKELDERLMEEVGLGSGYSPY